MPAALGGARQPPPKVVVTFVIDGGGWNVLQTLCRTPWPNLKRLMGEGANFRNAITGSFPAVTACAHATIGTGAFPRTHGITGHNIRDGDGVRKAYGNAGTGRPVRHPGADAGRPLVQRDRRQRPWVGELGYQVWHLGMLGHGGKNRPRGDKPVAVYWAEDDPGLGSPTTPTCSGCRRRCRGWACSTHTGRPSPPPPSPDDSRPTGSEAPCCTPPIVQYPGRSHRGRVRLRADRHRRGPDGLLYINFKAPDYAGHVYGMFSKWTVLAEVDAQLGRLVALLEDRFPDGYALIVTADPRPVPAARRRRRRACRPDGARQGHRGEVPRRPLSPGPERGARRRSTCNPQALDDLGITRGDVAAFLRDYRYGENIGPYIHDDAIEHDLLDNAEFAAVFATAFLETLRGADLSHLGATRFTDGDFPMPDPPTA